MGHTNADVTLNVYTQVMDESLRTAVDRVGNRLFNIVHSGGPAGLEPARPSPQGEGRVTEARPRATNEKRSFE